jgi:hypothetical protein
MGQMRNASIKLSTGRDKFGKNLAQTTQKSGKNVKFRKDIYVGRFWDMTPCSHTRDQHFEVTRCPSFSEIRI